jgi:alpha-1,2-mannosyltransferase
MIGRPSKQILVGLFLFLYIPMTYWAGWILQSDPSVDFPTYYHAARIAFVEGKTPYGFSAFDAASTSMGRKVHPYLYPPTALLPFWPLARLPLLQARVIFLIASHLCLLGTIWLMLTRLLTLPSDTRLREVTIGLCLVYLLLFDPVLATFGLGQINLIALFFICLTLAGLKRERAGWRIGLPLAIAILLKTYPALLLLLLLVRRKYRAIAFTGVFFAAFTLISTVMLPGGIWASWANRIVPLGGYANNEIAAAAPWNQNINGFLTRLLVPNPFTQAPLPYPFLARPVITAVACVVIGLTVFASWRLSRRRDYASSGDHEMAAFVLMIFLVAPLSWDHHLVYILPAAVIAIASLVSGTVSGTVNAKAAVAILLALFLMAWRMPFDHPNLMHGWWTLLISVKFYPVVLLWLFFMSRLWKPAERI